MATVELPSFEMMTETIQGAGIAGEYASPVLGHFQSQVVKLTFRSPNEKTLALLAPVMHALDIRGSVSMSDPMLGSVRTQSLRIECRGQTKMHSLGKFEAGQVVGGEVELECSVIRIDLDGVRVVELDKFNMVYRVNGVDYLASVRRDLGGV